MAGPVYRRVVIKLSGEYLAGTQPFGIDQPTVDRIARAEGFPVHGESAMIRR